jgi:hypothetical protein
MLKISLKAFNVIGRQSPVSDYWTTAPSLEQFEHIFPGENQLINIALALGADEINPWSEQETTIVPHVSKGKRLNNGAFGRLAQISAC